MKEKCNCIAHHYLPTASRQLPVASAPMDLEISAETEGRANWRMKNAIKSLTMLSVAGRQCPVLDLGLLAEKEKRNGAKWDYTIPCHTYLYRRSPVASRECSKGPRNISGHTRG